LYQRLSVLFEQIKKANEEIREITEKNKKDWNEGMWEGS